MPNKTLYIRDDDMPIWARAEQAAKRRRQSLSAFVATALERALKEESEEATETDSEDHG